MNPSDAPYRSLCTDCGISRTDNPKRCGEACQFIKPNYPALETEFKDTMIQFTQETQQADNPSQVEAEMWYLHENLIVFKYRTFEFW